MPEALKERSEIQEQYKWDLTRMYADDAAWEKALDAFDAQLQALAAYAGKLNTAAGLRAREAIMETVTSVQENAADVLAEARALNEAQQAQ